MRKLALVMIGLILIVLAYLKAPEFLGHRAISADGACMANLEALKRTKEEWRAAAPRKLDAQPTEGDLFGPSWTNRMPVCPAGGIYRIGSLSEDPTCSLGGPAHRVRKP